MIDDVLLDFDVYKTDWLNKHPGYIPTEAVFESPYPWWAQGLCFLSFVTSAMVSGVHTMTVIYESIKVSQLVDENMRQWVGRGGFVAYELGMYLGAFLMAVQSTKKLAYLLIGIIFLTLISVNLYSVHEVYGFDLANDLAGSFVTAFFALVPVIAFASGKLYVNIIAGERAEKRRIKAEYDEAVRKLDDRILREYNTYVTKWKKEHTRSVPSTRTEPEARTEYVPSTIPKAVRDLADILKQNPGDLNLSAAQIRSKYSKGQTVANDAKKLANYELKKSGYINGHDTEQMQ